MTQTPSVSLKLPLLKEESLIKARTVLHLVRQGGAKIKHQVINNKHIFHNYGFGAAAVSLSFGAANLSSKSYSIFFDPTSHDGQCAVIGAGIMGIMTGLELIKRGRKVTIYSSQIAELEPKLENVQVSSQAMPVIWMPNEYEWSEDMLCHQLISKLSFDFLKESVELSRYQSIKEVSVVDVANDEGELKEVVSNYVSDMVKPGKIVYENGSSQQASLYRTFYIDSPLFMEEIKIEAMLRGVRFVKRNFSSLQEVLSLQETAIWNCTNGSSSYLFEESGLQERQYLLLDFEEESGQKGQFVFKGRAEEEFELQCVGKKKLLILKTNVGKLSNQQIREKLATVNRLFESLSLKAKL